MALIISTAFFRGVMSAVYGLVFWSTKLFSLYQYVQLSELSLVRTGFLQEIRPSRVLLPLEDFKAQEAGGNC